MYGRKSYTNDEVEDIPVVIPGVVVELGKKNKIKKEVFAWLNCGE